MIHRCIHCGSLIFRHELNVDCAYDGKILKTYYIHERCLEGFIEYVQSVANVESIEKVKK